MKIGLKEEEKINRSNPASLSSEPLEIENLRLALDNMTDMISRLKMDGTFLYVSRSCHNLLGYKPKELINKNILDICHPHDIEKIHEAQRELKNKANYRVTYRVRRAPGDYIWLESIATKITNNHELTVVSRDITERIVTEEEIKETREKYRLLVEYSKDTIGMITPEGIWTYINETGKRLLGTTSHLEVIGTSLLDYLSPGDQKVLRNHLGLRENAQFEIDIIRRDNYVRKVECQIISTNFKNRDMYHIIITDVTEQKHTEEQLQNTEKLSVVGQLAAGVAHEIRNPLTAIKGFTQLLDISNRSDYKKIILDELERIEQIVSDLLVLAKPQVSNKEKANLITLTKQVVNLLNSETVMANIIIVENYPPSLIEVKCEPNKIKQVLINVIKNAIEAMPNGGELNVTVEMNQDHVVLKVIDEGVGISKDRLQKLGEPFYSTKEKGTGLGLMICKKIIENHMGEFHVFSEENQGTTVQITLPL